MPHRARALGTLLAGSLVLAAAPASAQEGVLFQNIMRNIGLIPGDAPEIDYRERPPLVVPPNSALPRPQESASAANPAWPNDPDVAARREERNDLLRPATQRERYRENQRPLLSQEELRRGRVAGRRATEPVGRSEGAATYEENIGPIRIGREMAGRRNEDAELRLRYGSEPARRTLTDPPTGYRMPAGTARLGPGRDGPREDTSDSTGQREFAAGLPNPTARGY